MSGALRIVFSWLLAVALPLQGAAAASMTLCGTRGQGAPVHHHVQERHKLPTSALHAIPGPEAVRGHAGHHADTGNPETAAKCNVCAACCASMAIAVADFSLPLVVLSESFVALSGTGASPFVTEGLDDLPELPPSPDSAWAEWSPAAARRDVARGDAMGRRRPAGPRLEMKELRCFHLSRGRVRRAPLSR